MAGPRVGVLKERKYTLDEITHAAKVVHRQLDHESVKLTETRVSDDWMLCDEEICTAWRNKFDEVVVEIEVARAKKEKSKERRRK